jgi:hypothetical protein
MAIGTTARDGAASFGNGVDAVKACKVDPFDTYTNERRLWKKVKKEGK